MKALLAVLVAVLVVLALSVIPASVSAKVNPACNAPLDQFILSVDKAWVKQGDEVTITVSSTYTGSRDGTVSRFVVLPSGLEPLSPHDMDAQRMLTPWHNTMTRTVVGDWRLWFSAVFSYTAGDGSFCQVGKSAWVYVGTFFN